MTDRVTNLEIKLTFLEETVDELNGVVIAQGKRIDQLLALIERLQARLEEGSGPDVVDERPPHW